MVLLQNVWVKKEYKYKDMHISTFKKDNFLNKS